MTLPVAIRAAVAADAGLIIQSWLRSYFDSRSPAIWDIPRSVFFSDQGHHGIVTGLLSRANVIVAHAPDDADEIYGWLCVEEGRAVHYVYVKELWRRKGVASLLLRGRADPITVSHFTRAFRDGPGRGRKFTYDPYAQRETG